MNWRAGLLWVLAAAAVVTTFLLPPITQNPAYHDFADQRALYGIPNFWNVVSNAAFILAGLYGIAEYRKARWLAPRDRIAWLVVIIASILIGVGSGYYHVHPNDRTLVWDRLPMTLAFMGVFSAAIGEFISARWGYHLLGPLLLAGIASVEAWRYTGDLSYYMLVQFYPMLALPIILLLFHSRYTHTSGWWLMILFYVAAKLFEEFDRAMGRVAGFSGHPLKHVAGGLALAAVFRMIAVRDGARRGSRF